MTTQCVRDGCRWNRVFNDRFLVPEWLQFTPGTLYMCTIHRTFHICHKRGLSSWCIVDRKGRCKISGEVKNRHDASHNSTNNTSNGRTVEDFEQSDWFRVRFNKQAFREDLEEALRKYGVEGRSDRRDDMIHRLYYAFLAEYRRKRNAWSAPSYEKLVEMCEDLHTIYTCKVILNISGNNQSDIWDIMELLSRTKNKQFETTCDKLITYSTTYNDIVCLPRLGRRISYVERLNSIIDRRH